MSTGIIELGVAVVVAFVGSSGLWAYITSRQEKHSANTQLMLGLAHDRIVFLGMSYLDRGWITKDEYEDFLKYLWEPYSEFGGNGLAERVVNDVKTLPIRNHARPPVTEERSPTGDIPLPSPKMIKKHFEEGENQ